MVLKRKSTQQERDERTRAEEHIFPLTEQAPSSGALGGEEIAPAPERQQERAARTRSDVGHMIPLLIKNVRRNLAALTEGNCGLRDFKGAFYLKYLRKYVPKPVIFTYLVRVLKGMQKKKNNKKYKHLSFGFWSSLNFLFPISHKVFLFKQDDNFSGNN